MAHIPVLALIAGLVACAPTEHSVEPYRSDPKAAAELTARAFATCVNSSRNSGTQPIRPFVTDGCSRIPDFEWNLACCVEHDVLYWCGGTAEERVQADDEFGACVSSQSNGFLGWFMRTGVRIGGHPFFPSDFRWGYGHPYRATYPSALSTSGEQSAEDTSLDPRWLLTT